MADEDLSVGGTAVDHNAAPQPQWYQPAESLKTSDPEVWTSFENGIKSGAITDLPSLIKKGIGAEKRLGSALVPPGKDAKPEEIAAFKEKLYATGHIAKPPVLPESPEKYEIKADIIPENRRLPEIMTKAQQWAHKHGITQEAFDEGMALNAEQFGVGSQLFKGQKEAALTRVAAIAAKEGRDMNAVMEGGKRAAQKFLQDSPEELAEFNDYLGDHPSIMYILSRMGEALGEDSHQLGDGTGGSGAADAQAEYADAQAIAYDPKHSQHEAYLKEGMNGPLHDKIDAAYKKRFGTKEE